MGVTHVWPGVLAALVMIPVIFGILATAALPSGRHHK